MFLGPIRPCTPVTRLVPSPTAFYLAILKTGRTTCGQEGKSATMNNSHLSGLIAQKLSSTSPLQPIGTRVVSARSDASDLDACLT